MAGTAPYKTYLDFPAWDHGPELISALIDREEPQRVLELGGGRNPTMPVDEVRRRGLSYTVNDVDADELALADPGYETLCADMSAALDPRLADNSYDLIFSRMVNEHVPDGERYYANIQRLLRPGGLTVHYFATLGALPFLVNRLVPTRASGAMLRLAFAENPDAHEKFRARYSWCVGPTPAMHERFESLGYNVEAYQGYFGHGYYIRLKPLHRLELAKARWLCEHPIASLTCYAMLALRKPVAPARPSG